MTKRKQQLAPPPGLEKDAAARWLVVAPILAKRGPIDRDTLTTYCQVWVRWRQAEAALAKTGQLVRSERGRPMASPLISVSSQASAQVRALERSLGLDASKLADVEEAATERREKRAGVLVTRRELAGSLGVHMQTVTKWEREGMPISAPGGKGRATRYSEADVRAWRRQREELAAKPGSEGVDLIKERARKERAQAVLAEQAYSIRTRDLLPREEVEKGWAAVIGAVRTKLLALPATLSDQLARAAVTDGVAGVERVLQTAVSDALRELAQMKGDGVAA